MTGIRQLVVYSAAIGLATPLVACAATSTSPTPSGNFFDEVTNAHLASLGMVLSAPAASEQPAISSASAEQTGLAVIPGQTIRRILLLHVHFVQPPLPDALCWVMSMWPPGGLIESSGPASSPRKAGHIKFRIAFVDAITGSYLLSIDEGTNS